MSVRPTAWWLRGECQKLVGDPARSVQDRIGDLIGTIREAMRPNRMVLLWWQRAEGTRCEEFFSKHLAPHVLSGRRRPGIGAERWGQARRERMGRREV